MRFDRDAVAQIAADPRHALHGIADGIAHGADLVAVAPISLALVGFALAQRRQTTAALAAALLAVANVTCQLLQDATGGARSVQGLMAMAATPSGHATAAVSIAGAAYVVAPSAHRRSAALVGGTYALAVAVAVLVNATHVVTDVVAGLLLGAACALAVLAIERQRLPSYG
jgi:membrane-associated phospholipid phosphatase